MIALSIESSHIKGMGHFFRGLNLVNYLKYNNINFLVLINNDNEAISILQKLQIPYIVVDYNDITSNWESSIIKKYNIKIWINDRLNTDINHSKNLKENKTKIITFDDKGSGAILADINIVALARDELNQLKGKKVLSGKDYLILNKDIDLYKRLRKDINNILVTMGGSDTYGVTLNVVNKLVGHNLNVTIHTGPSFRHFEELKKNNKENFNIITNVSSLIETFNKFDLAVTAGGITPFEANASGLPCIIIANEKHEIHNATYLDNLGSSIFIGYYQDLDFTNLNIIPDKLNLEKMSHIGLNNISINGVDNIFKEINLLCLK